MTTQKKATSFRLSDEALAQLADLAKRKHISQAAAIELALREMAVSTPEQREWQDVARKHAFLSNLKDHEEAHKTLSPVQVGLARKFFVAGYNIGWLHYQTRHNLDQLFEIGDLTPQAFRAKLVKAYMARK